MIENIYSDGRVIAGVNIRRVTEATITTATMQNASVFLPFAPNMVQHKYMHVRSREVLKGKSAHVVCVCVSGKRTQYICSIMGIICPCRASARQARVTAQRFFVGGLHERVGRVVSL